MSDYDEFLRAKMADDGYELPPLTVTYREVAVTLTKAQHVRDYKAIAGEYIDHPTDAEKTEIERRWFAAGRSNADLGRIQGWNRKVEPVMYKAPQRAGIGVQKGVALNPDQIEMIRATYRRLGNRQQAAIHLGLDRTTIVRHTRDIEPVKSHAKTDLTWQEDAACIGVPVDAFFPSGDGDYETIQQAKRICSGCSVVADCLTFAIQTNSSSGVFGGVYIDTRGRVRAGVSR